MFRQNNLPVQAAQPNQQVNPINNHPIQEAKLTNTTGNGANIAASGDLYAGVSAKANLKFFDKNNNKTKTGAVHQINSNNSHPDTGIHVTQKGFFNFSDCSIM